MVVKGQNKTKTNVQQKTTHPVSLWETLAEATFKEVRNKLIIMKYRGFIKFLCRRSVGFFSRAFLVFLMKESKKRRQKQPGKLMAKSHSQPVNMPGARPLMNPLEVPQKVSVD